MLSTRHKNCELFSHISAQFLSVELFIVFLLHFIEFEVSGLDVLWDGRSPLPPVTGFAPNLSAVQSCQVKNGLFLDFIGIYVFQV